MMLRFMVFALLLQPSLMVYILRGRVDIQEADADLGDYDGDDDLDLVVCGDTSEFVQVSQLLRNDNGTFVDVNANLQPVSGGSVRWGDYDSDGDLDILLAGRKYPASFVFLYYTVVYRNDNGSFVNVNASLPGLVGNGVWGDYDSDNDLDILLSGSFINTEYTDEHFAGIFRNDNGTFNIGATLHPVAATSATWVDYDRDGYLDAFITGRELFLDPDIGPGWRAATRMYRNDHGAFTEVELGFADLQDAAIAWGDYDNDYDPDLFLSGSIPYGIPEAHLYRNDNGTFTEDDATQFVAVDEARASWGDFDKDDDLDLAVFGHVRPTDDQPAAAVYRNDNGTWINIPSNILGERLGSLHWRDYNNDGHLDIVTAGVGGVRIYAEPAAPMFTWVPAAVPQLTSGASSWARFNDDGYPDLLLAGRKDTGEKFAGIYLNVRGVFTQLNTSTLGNDGAYEWGNYDGDGDQDVLFAGASSDGSEIAVYRNDNGTLVKAVSLATDGTPNAFWGDYDNDHDLDVAVLLNSSSGPRTLIYRNDHGNFSCANSSLQGSTEYALWGDYDRDDDLDLFIGGDTYYVQSLIYRNDNGTFRNINATLPPMTSTRAAWGDVDNDLDLDLLVSGYSTSSLNVLTRIFRNEQGSFTQFNTTNFRDVYGAGVECADIDNDADVDVIIAGISGDQSLPRYLQFHIYLNDGNGTFTVLENTAVLASAILPSENLVGFFELVDFENDGDLDVFTVGVDSGFNARSVLFRNDIVLPTGSTLDLTEQAACESSEDFWTWLTLHRREIGCRVQAFRPEPLSGFVESSCPSMIASPSGSALEGRRASVNATTSMVASCQKGTCLVVAQYVELTTKGLVGSQVGKYLWRQTESRDILNDCTFNHWAAATLTTGETCVVALRRIKC